ncbi:hypothetical protein HFP15_30960 [Amycolatopsis sp. K13G38]|uniref:ApeA N-terminal domain-containing protein n=1 Tax=Amycolatopsis acididurans TaxID=2724524 RepID=A0ABX1JBX5_9PSEU|nr:hypothetical protein [Amycolatopsis acididurans]NKQ57297.1 hypothetical protein [Amycolatopsis acididurans]
MAGEVQFDGEFWLPDNPDNKISGVVTFSPTAGGTLSLIGSFADISDRINQRPTPNYQRIVGETAHGGLTLDDCRRTFENPFGRRQRFAVGKLLVNAYYGHGEPVDLDRLVTRISDLVLWLLDGAPKMVPAPEALADSIPIADQQTEVIPLDAGARLNLIHRLSFTVDVGRTELRQTATPRFEFDAPVELDSALEHAFDLLAAVTIAADRVVAFDDVHYSHPALTKPDGSTRQLVDVHEQWRVQADPHRKQLTDDRMAFTYAQLGGVDGLRRFLGVIRDHRALVRQVLRPRYDTAPTVQDSFFTRVAALEGLDKQQHQDGYILVKWRAPKISDSTKADCIMLLADR